ncbi:mandelate racemase/muconate lactonizing enzyme family protein [Nesterenkonia alba]|uniref:mandelate racemase/muconate lactonizing enzyme family protein n=1 Tax=Nesterenkonia alba TaxID=515814 RepID=UPI0003B5E293|nr:mandelate racemase/muconate lactonizing enzyme family protein [Nesterenkonia alba]
MSVPVITSCQLELLSYKYTPQEAWGWPGGRYDGWTSGFIRLTGEDGTVGYGEIGDGLNVRQMVRPIVDWTAERVTGLPAEPRGVLEKLTRAAPSWGHGGLYQSVVSGIEAACFDLLGRHLGVPAHVLVGGAYRRELPAYASGGLAEDPEELAAEVRGYVADGFQAVKIRIGYGLDRDEERVAAAREALGPDGDLMVDLGASYLPDPPDVHQVIAMAARFEPYRLYWFEDPLPRTEVHAHAILRGEMQTRLAFGEAERTPDHIVRMLEAGAVDIIQPDAVSTGGILRLVELGALAQSHGARLAPHTWCSGPGLMANLTVVAASPAAVYLEVPRVPNPLREQTLQEPLTLVDGKVQLPDTPGLGLNVTEEIRSWSYDPTAGPRLANA